MIIWGKFMWDWAFQVLVAIDQLLNSILRGYADETLSSRAHRMGTMDSLWALFEKAIDLLFFWQDHHCKLSHEAGLRRRRMARRYVVRSRIHT